MEYSCNTSKENVNTLKLWPWHTFIVRHKIRSLPLWYLSHRVYDIICFQNSIPTIRIFVSNYLDIFIFWYFYIPMVKILAGWNINAFGLTCNTWINYENHSALVLNTRTILFKANVNHFLSCSDCTFALPDLLKVSYL